MHLNDTAHAKANRWCDRKNLMCVFIWPMSASKRDSTEITSYLFEACELGIIIRCNKQPFYKFHHTFCVFEMVVVCDIATFTTFSRFKVLQARKTYKHRSCLWNPSYKLFNIHNEQPRMKSILSLQLICTCGILPRNDRLALRYSNFNVLDCIVQAF